MIAPLAVIVAAGILTFGHHGSRTYMLGKLGEFLIFRWIINLVFGLSLFVTGLMLYIWCIWRIGFIDQIHYAVDWIQNTPWYIVS